MTKRNCYICQHLWPFITSGFTTSACSLCLCKILYYNHVLEQKNTKKSCAKSFKSRQSQSSVRAEHTYLNHVICNGVW